jgi:septal ring factor EnvC (AmiA/AmiB activator)
MSRGRFVLLLLVAGLFGIWGCSQGAGNSANAERIRALETKLARLEEDFKGSVTVREQLRKKLSTVEEEKVQLTQQVEHLQGVVKERDDLKQQLALRTGERDAVQNQFNNLCKGIKTLIGQMETPTVTTSQPATSTVATSVVGKS